MRIRLLAGVAGLAICATMHPLAGQRVRGQVLHPDSATAAVGIIVVATDEKGAFLARALTSERGDFELALPGAGRYTVRALRIGYRPTILPALSLAEGETRTIRIVLGGAAVTLAPVRVRGESVCRIRQDSGQQVASLWEEARKALTAAQLSSSSGRLLAHWTVYDTVTDRSGRVVLEGTERSMTGFSDHPFVSIPADSLPPPTCCSRSRSRNSTASTSNRRPRAVRSGSASGFGRRAIGGVSPTSRGRSGSIARPRSCAS